jgi:hypothetical protein
MVAAHTPPSHMADYASPAVFGASGQTKFWNWLASIEMLIVARIARLRDPKETRMVVKD